MDKGNLELFKQAISEAVSNKFDNIAANRSEETVCSERHNLAIRAIMYGKSDVRRSLSPKAKRIIAILIAAALLLTSCGIIFRNEIREVIEEFFTSITFEGNESDTKTIEEIYKLNYLPKGYTLQKEQFLNTNIKYTFINENDNVIIFVQGILDGSSFVIDSESGYSKILEVEKITVYHRYVSDTFFYLWTDGKYSMFLSSTTELSNEDLIKILKGISIK